MTPGRGPSVMATEEHAFLRHALSGDEAGFQGLLEKEDVNQIARRGAKPLHCAAACQSMDPAKIIDRLVKRGAAVNKTCDCGATPLHVAAATGNARGVAALLRVADEYDTPVDVNAQIKREGFTALHLVAASGAETAQLAVQQLLQAGAEVDAKSQRGLTALHVAANFGTPSAVAALLEAGADATAVLEGGLTPLHLAASMPERQTATAMIDVLSAVDWIGSTEPHPMLIKNVLLSVDAAAAGPDDSHLLGRVRSLGLEVSSPSRNPLAEKPQPAANGGADPAAAAKVARAAPDLAPPKGCLAGLFALCGKPKPDAAARSSGNALALTTLSDLLPQEETPLQQLIKACPEGRHAECAALLAAKGCPVNATTDKGVTALMLAAKKADVALLKKLLELGGDASMVDDDGCNALHWCCKHSGECDLTAAGNQSPAILDLLLAAGLRIDQCDNSKRMPLHYACGCGNLPLTSHLVKLQADVNTINNSGHTALWDVLNAKAGNVALQEDRAIIVSQLLQAGAHVDPTMTDAKGTDLITHAVSSRWHAAAAAILEHSRSRGMSTALTDHVWEQVAQNATVTSPLLEELPTDRKVALQALANAWKAAKARAPFVELGRNFNQAANFLVKQPDGSKDYAGALLLRLCNDKNQAMQDDVGDTALHLAVRYGVAPAVAHLLKANAPVHIQNAAGFTPLHELIKAYSAEPGVEQVVSEMLARGGDASAVDGDGVPPLHWACQTDNPEPARLLVAGGAPVGAVDREGRTAAHVLLTSCMQQVAAMRLDAGILRSNSYNGPDLGCSLPGGPKVLRRTSAGHIPTRSLARLSAGAPTMHSLSRVSAGVVPPRRSSLSISRTGSVQSNTALPSFMRHSSIGRKSRSTVDGVADAKPPSLLQQINQVVANYKATMTMLLENGADVNQADNLGNTSLHVACTGAPQELLDLLIASGAKLDAKNQTGQTPLHVACMQETVAIVRVLIKASAPMEAEDKDRRTPLHLSCLVGTEHCTRELVRHGAEVNNVDQDRRTPLHMVCSRTWADDIVNGNIELHSLAAAKALVQHNAAVNELDARLRHPILLAYESGHVRIAHYLWEHGADPSNTYGNGIAIFQQGLRVADMYLVQHLITHSRTLELYKNKTSTGHTFLEYLCLLVRQVGAFMPYALCMDALLVLRLPVTLGALANIWGHIAETCRALHFTPEDHDHVETDLHLLHNSAALLTSAAVAASPQKSKSGELETAVASPKARVSPREEGPTLQLANRLTGEIAPRAFPSLGASRLEPVQEETGPRRSHTLPSRMRLGESEWPQDEAAAWLSDDGSQHDASEERPSTQRDSEGAQASERGTAERATDASHSDGAEVEGFEGNEGPTAFTDDDIQGSQEGEAGKDAEAPRSTVDSNGVSINNHATHHSDDPAPSNGKRSSTDGPQTSAADPNQVRIDLDERAQRSQVEHLSAATSMNAGPQGSVGADTCGVGSSTAADDRRAATLAASSPPSASPRGPDSPQSSAKPAGKGSPPAALPRLLIPGAGTPALPSSSSSDGDPTQPRDPKVTQTPCGFKALRWDMDVGEMLARGRCPEMSHQQRIESVQYALQASHRLLSLWRSQVHAKLIIVARLPATGETALHLAARCHIWGAVELLLSDGASTLDRCKRNLTPLHHLVESLAKRPKPGLPSAPAVAPSPIDSNMSTPALIDAVKASKMYKHLKPGPKIKVDKFLDQCVSEQAAAPRNSFLQQKSW